MALSTPPPSPENLPAAPTASPEYTLDQTRGGLDKLKTELSAPEKAGELMKNFEQAHVDTSEWKRDPKLAIPSVEKYFPNSESKKYLLYALGQPETSDEFKDASRALQVIIDGVANRRREIDQAKRALGDLNENALNRVAEHGVKGVFDGISRAGTSDIILFGLAAVVLVNHIWNKDPNNTILRNLAIGGIGIFGANSLSLHLSGKSLMDRGHDMGLSFLPSAKKELPQQLQLLADSAHISQPRELMAMGRLGEHSMKEVYSQYEHGQGTKTIDPAMFGFPADGSTIGPGELFHLVETLVKRHDDRKIGKRSVGKDGDFKNDFVDNHNYSFLEAGYLLYEKDVGTVLEREFTPEKKTAYLKKMEKDTKDMFSDSEDAHATRVGDMMSFYGVKFHARVEAENADENSAYTFELGSGRSVRVRKGETTGERAEECRQLKEYAKDYIQEFVKEKYPESSVADGNLQYSVSDHLWHFKDVELKGVKRDVVVMEGSDDVGVVPHFGSIKGVGGTEGKLVAKVNGKMVTDWSKLEEAC